MQENNTSFVAQLCIDQNDATEVLAKSVEQMPDMRRHADHFNNTTNHRNQRKPSAEFRNNELIATVLRHAAARIKVGQTVNAHIAFKNVSDDMRAPVLGFMQEMENAGKIIATTTSGHKRSSYPTSYFVPTNVIGIWRRTTTMPM